MSKPLLVVAALSIAAAGPAFADEAGQVQAAPTAAVSTANVDFRDQAAVRAFYARLRNAAHAVCDSNSANPRITQRDERCVAKAVASAVQAADRPLLTALYDTTGEAQASR